MKTNVSKNVKNDSTTQKESLTEIVAVVPSEISNIEEVKSEENLPVEIVSPVTPKIDAKKEAERIIESTLLINKIYRIGREIETKEKLLERNLKTLEKWNQDDQKRLNKITERFETDKINKIIELKESNCIEGKNILIEYYQKLIEKLIDEKTIQENTGELGEFSPEFQEYLNDRTQKFEKQIYNLNKNYQQYAQEKREITIPKIIESIEKLKEDLVNAQKEAEEYKNK